MPTVLEWLEKIPTLDRQQVVGRTIPRGPRVRTLPDGRPFLSQVVHVHDHPLWLTVINRSTGGGKYSFRLRVWLRNLDRTLLPIEDTDGFITVRGAEWAAYHVLNKLTHDMRAADRKFIESVEKVEEEVSQ